MSKIYGIPVATPINPNKFATGLSNKQPLTGWTITENGDTVTLDYTLEGDEPHTDVITFDANGYPVSITHDGVTAEGTWTEG